MIDSHAAFPALREPSDHTPIHWLPSELLLRIFYLTAYRSYHPDCCIEEMGCLTDTLPPELRDVISAASVCHRWRSIINTAPELWCHLVDPLHPREEWKRLLLKRSKPLGISYVSGKREWDLQGGISKGTEENKRLTHYRFDISPREHIGWPIAPNSWPRLEFLCVRMQAPAGSNNTVGDDKKILPFEFPGASTPKLKQLHFHNCIFRTVTSLTGLSKTLAHLHVLNPPLSSAPSINLWFGIIQSLPLLSSLKLDRALGEIHSSSLPGRWKVELNLEEFTLKDTTRNCAQMLSRATFTQPCRFLCLRLETSFSDPDLESVFTHLLPVVQSISFSPSFMKCALEADALEFNCLGLSTEFQGDKMSPFYLQPHLRTKYLTGSVRIALFYKGRQDPPSTQQVFIFDSLCKLFRPFLSDVEYFQPLTDLASCHRGSIFNLLTRCQNLYRLELLTPSIWSIICRYTSQRSRLDRHSQIFLPALREIQFFITDPPKDGQYRHHNPLVRFCKYRREIQCPMRKIYNPTYFFASTGEDTEGGRAFSSLKSQLSAFDVQTVFRWEPEQGD